jgi:hypothetical protein
MIGNVAASVRYIATSDGTVLLDTETGRCFGLNPTGAAVWAAARTGAGVEQVVRELSARFAANEDRIRGDVRRLIAELHAVGLLVDPSEQR